MYNSAQENKSKWFTATRVRNIAYWAATAIIIWGTALGSIWDLARESVVKTIMSQLGYPFYFITIMGFWKVLAVIALLVPGFGRIKEWAYAGLFFVYTGAFISNLAVGHINDAFGPAIFAAILIASWALRPASRRLVSSRADIANSRSTKTKTIFYWITTSMLFLCLISGGIGELGHLWGTLQTVTLLGYPAYFLSIIGSWKLLACLTILISRFPRLKEWAYAGVFFVMTGAATSHLVCHDYGPGGAHIIVTLFFAALTLASWALRPASRSQLIIGYF